jgi:hypothetical protein
MSMPKKMATCHPEKEHVSHGLCRACYSAKLRAGTLQEYAQLRKDGMCVSCKRNSATFASLEGSGGKRLKYCIECREKSNFSKSRCRLESKVEVLSHYGPNGVLGCCWKDCEVTDPDMLSLDHKDNTGNVERKRGGNFAGGVSFYRKLKRDSYPEGLQTLCYNHQWKKEILRRRADINGTPSWKLEV